MIKWDASHPIRWISSRGIYSEHWIGIAEKKNKKKTVRLERKMFMMIFFKSEKRKERIS